MGPRLCVRSHHVSTHPLIHLFSTLTRLHTRYAAPGRPQSRYWRLPFLPARLWGRWASCDRAVAPSAASTPPFSRRIRRSAGCHAVESGHV